MKMGETLGEAAREPLTAMGPQPPRKTSSAGAERHLRGLSYEGVPAEMSMGKASPLTQPLGDGRGEHREGWGFGWRSDPGRARRARHLLKRGESQSRA